MATTVKGLMRVVEEEFCKPSIVLALWSNKLDLAVVANKAGEVSLHRLNWQYVWFIPPPAKDVQVTALAWRPDGRAFAVGYETGEVRIVDAEKKSTIQIFNMNDPVCFMCWFKEPPANREQKYKEMMKSSEYFAKLIPFTGQDGNKIPISNFAKIREQKELNFLFIGLKCGKIRIYVFGLVCCGVLDVKQYFTEESVCTILHIDMAPDLKRFFVVFNVDKGNCREVQCAIFDTSHLAEYSQYLYILACKFSYVSSIVGYINHSIRMLTDSWENIKVNEMMLKLNKYAEGKPEQVLSTDFLELFMFGICSPSMENFLLRDLSMDNIKKINAAIEMNHTTIQELVLRHLMPAVQNMMCEITLLRGLVICPSDSEMAEKVIETCIVATCAVSIKATEFLDIIDDSLIMYQTFFCWLISIHLMLTDEVPDNDDLSMSQREQQSLFEYLHDLDRLAGTTISETKDALSQYLKNEDLSIIKNSDSKWKKFLQENSCLEKCNIVNPNRFQKMSLIQQHAYMNKCVEDVFQCSENFITSKCLLITQCAILSESTAYTKVVASVKNNRLCAAAIYWDKGKTFLRISEIFENGDFYFPHSVTFNFDCDHVDNPYSLLDVSFYTDSVLSLLIDQVGSSHTYYTQLPIELIRNDFGTSVVKSIFSVISDEMKVIQNMKATRFTISGIRKVVVVIAEDAKVRVYEMEVDEDADRTMSENDSGPIDMSNQSLPFNVVQDTDGNDVIVIE